MRAHTNTLSDPPAYEPEPEETLRGEAHPLWERQVEMERGMLRDGADRVRDRVIRATERRQMTRLAPVRKLMSDWLPPVAEQIKEWVRQTGRGGGPKPIALPYIQPADPFVLGLVAVRTILDSITTERTAVTGLALEIGRASEHEMMIRRWEEQDPESFWQVQSYLDRTDSTSSHRRLVNINRFNAILRKEDPSLGWAKWGVDVQLRVGLALIDSVTRATGWFELVPDPNFIVKPGVKRGPKLVLVAKPALAEWVGSRLDHEELNSPAFKPTVIPPKPWASTKGGGYWTPYVRTPRLIRFKAHQEAQKDRAADEYEALDMPQVYEAINYLQDVPWRINTRVLDVVMAAWNGNMGLAGLPLDAPLERPLAPADAEENPDALKAWKRQTSHVIRRDMKRIAEVETVKRVLGVAFEYASFEEIFFPHMMDFRGRMYPIPVGLQPQGDDLARGLLEFAHGKEVTEENGGVGWLAIHLSACWGYDKASYEDRIAWAQEREPLWRRIAAEPLVHLEWAVTTGPAKVDKPWCVLAAIFEYVACLDHGFGFLSSLPVSVDGTCNGIQHLSAMTRDRVAGEHVNLVPGPAPRDIYKFVAAKLQDALERIVAERGHGAEEAVYWLDLCNQDLPRSLTKRQVMVLPYGGSKDSFFTYARVWLDEHDPLPKDLDFSLDTSRALLRTRNARLSLLVSKMWAEVRMTVSGGVEVMEWLQKCARVTVKANQPIVWTTPSGFVVRHFYGKQKERLVETMMDGQRVQLRVSETTDQLDAVSQLRGIAPNFVHSLDASALALSLLAAKERRIQGFTSVHDAYGTHAADMWPLYHILREAFVLVHATDMLATYRRVCAAVLVGQLVAERPSEDFLALTELAEEQLPKVRAMGHDIVDTTGVDHFDRQYKKYKLAGAADAEEAKG